MQIIKFKRNDQFKIWINYLYWYG